MAHANSYEPSEDITPGLLTPLSISPSGFCSDAVHDVFVKCNLLSNDWQGDILPSSLWDANLPALLCSFLHFPKLTHSHPSPISLSLYCLNLLVKMVVGSVALLSADLLIDFNINDQALLPAPPNTDRDKKWAHTHIHCLVSPVTSR